MAHPVPWLASAQTSVASLGSSAAAPWGFDSMAAIGVSVGVATAVCLLAGHLYWRRRRAWRFGLLGTTIILAPLWLFVAFAVFDRIYWGY